MTEDHIRELDLTTIEVDVPTSSGALPAAIAVRESEFHDDPRAVKKSSDSDRDESNSSGSTPRFHDVQDLDLTKSESDVPNQKGAPKAARTEKDPDSLPRAWLAYIMAMILAFIVVASYVTLWFGDDQTATLDGLLTQLLSPITTIIGVVVTFYFAQRLRRK